MFFPHALTQLIFFFTESDRALGIILLRLDEGVIGADISRFVFLFILDRDLGLVLKSQCSSSLSDENPSGVVGFA